MLQSLSPLEADLLLHDWSGLWARDGQLLPDGDWQGWLLLAGRGYGKTRAGAETVRQWCRDFEFVNLVGKDPADVRDVMILGESGIMACCPKAERPQYRPSLRRLDWPSGARSLIFSAEDPEGLRGPQHEKLWMDEPCAWAYPQETWDMAMLGLRLGTNPQWVATTTPKPIALLRSLLDDPGVRITKGSTYENRENLAPSFLAQIVRRYEGTRLGRQELLAELLLDEGLAYRVAQGTHVVAPFKVPDSWRRFESMDYGTTNPTAWGAYCVDYDGNVIVHGLYYSPGLVPEHATAVHRLRRDWWPEGAVPVCYGPPDLHTRWPAREPGGKEISLESEFAKVGITFAMAQTDRRAGYQRIAVALRENPERRFPEWHARAGEKGSPELFFMDRPECAPLLEQLRDAMLESPDSARARFPGEAIDGDWESAHGHAHAMLRYGMMSMPRASARADEPLEDPRAELMRRNEERFQQRMAAGDGRYTSV